MASALSRTTGQAVEVKTPARTQKHTTIVQPEVSTRRVGKVEHMNAVRDSRELPGPDKGILWAAGTRAHMDGSSIFPTQETWAADAGVSRRTLQRRVPELVRDGWLRQVSSGKGGKSTKASEYHLTVPVVIEVNASSGGALESLTTQGQCATEDSSMRHSVAVNASPGGATTDPETDPENRSSSPAGPVGDAGDSQKETPSGEGPAPFCDWDDPDDGGYLAEVLGVSVASIGKPFRVWLEGFLASVEFDRDGDDNVSFWVAAQMASRARTSPVGYFRSILPGVIEQHRATQAASF
jgi:hypothetical protein